MSVPQVACTHCGKNFTTDDLRRTSCKYCGTLLAHHARAQQQVAVINEMLADRNGNGIPDAYEGVVANAQRNAFGMAMNPYGSPMQGPVMNPLANPVMSQVHMANMQIAQTVTKTVSTITIIVIISVVFFTLLGLGITVGVLFWAR